MMAFSSKGQKSPEEWLKEEASWQLTKIIHALNAAHTMPFECVWLESDIVRTYLEMLSGMESLLLTIWSQFERKSISKIEHQIMIWYGRQKRSQNSILTSFYLHQERLDEWSSLPEVKSYGLSGSWSDYLLFIMAVEKNYLTKASSGIIFLQESEREAIATIFLSKMQMLFNAEPYQLCMDFFTWISPFTQESVFLPCHKNDDQKQTKFTNFDKFRTEMTTNDQWSSLYKMYMDVLDEISGEKR